MLRRLTSHRVDVLLTGGALVFIYLVTPFEIHSDANARYLTLSALLTDGSIGVTPYSLVGPLFSAPLWWFGSLFDEAKWWCERYNFVLFVLGLVGFYRILTPVIEREMVTRFLLILTVASMFSNHLSNYFGEVFTAMTVALGLTLVCLRQNAWGWVLVVLGVANTPGTLPGMGLVAVGWSWRTRNIRHLAPVLVAAALVLLENWIRRGDPFTTGYEDNRATETILPYSGLPGFSYPLYLGLLSVLFSFGKGLFLFAPGLLLIPGQVAGRLTVLRTIHLVWLAFLLGLVLVYSKWFSWYGGIFWGPRFFLFGSIPAALALAAWCGGCVRSRWTDALGVVFVLWSCWVGANGLVFRLYELQECWANNYQLELLCLYVPEFSVLFRPFVQLASIGAVEATALTYFAIVGLYLVAPRISTMVRPPADDVTTGGVSPAAVG